MADIVDLAVDQGSRYVAVIKPNVGWLTSLVGYSARGSVKASRTIAGLPVLADLSPYLSVDAPNGLVNFDLPATVSAAWSFEHAEYDIELYNGTPAHDVRIVQGTIHLNKEVTT